MSWIATARKSLGLLLIVLLPVFLVADVVSAKALGARALCGEDLAYGAPRRLLQGKRGGLTLICKHEVGYDESFYLAAYDRRHRVPLWTAYRLTAVQMEAAAHSGITRRSHGRGFYSEPGLRRLGLGIATLSGDDYKGAGRDRGHLVPAAAMAYDPVAYAATFTVANLALQDAKLNRGAWRRLEARVRAWAQARGAIYVITGVVLGKGGEVFTPRDKPRLRIAVPKAFYKVIYDPIGRQMIAFVFDNAPPRHQGLVAAAVSVDCLEVLTGLDFFPRMPQPLAAALEGHGPDVAAWGLDATRGLSAS